MLWKKIKAVICWIFSALISLGLLAGVVLGYFIRTTNAEGNIVDGLGRLLDESPGVLRYILRHWAGSVWFGIDVVVIVIGLVAANMLYGIGKDLWNNVYRDYENNFF